MKLPHPFSLLLPRCCATAVRRAAGLAVLAGFASTLCGQIIIDYTDGQNDPTPYDTSVGALTLSVVSGSATQSGVLSGTDGIIKTGDGTLTLSGANTYAGDTTISAGTLTLAGSGTLGAGTVYLNNNATLDLGNTTQTVAGLGSLNNGLVGQISTGTINTTGFVVLQSGTFDASFAGSGADARLWIGGDPGATVTLNGTNDRVYTDDHNQVIIGFPYIGPGAGIVKVGNANALAAASENVHLFIGTLDLNGVANVRANSITLQPFDLLLVNNNTNSVASFGGAVTVMWHGQIGGTGDLALNGGISGDGILIKIGGGTLTLNGTTTLTGSGSVVSAGTLRVNGSFTDGGALTVNDGATLGGSGTIASHTGIDSGGILSPGNSPGTLTFTNGLTLNDGAILDFQLGTTSDRIVVSGGTLAGSTSAGGITLNLSDAGGFGANTYVLFDFTGATASSFDLSDFTLGSTIAGYDYSLAFNGSTLELVASASAVPEPATCAAMSGVLALLGAMGTKQLRRRRKTA